MPDLESEFYCLSGELRDWPEKSQLAAILRSAGFRVYEGFYSVRIEDYDHFIFQEYGGDLGFPQIEADWDSFEVMYREVGRLSGVLMKAGLAHRFEVYDKAQQLVAYFHHNWPQ